MIKVRYKRPNLLGINPVCFTVGIPARARLTDRLVEKRLVAPRQSRQSATSVVVASGGGLRRRTRRTVYINYIRSFECVFPSSVSVIEFQRRRERERERDAVHPSSVDGRPAGTREDRGDTHTERERGCRGCRGCRERERVDFNTHGTFMPTHRVGRRRVGWYTTANASHIIAHGWMDGCREVPPDGWMDARKPTTTIGAFHPIVRADLTTI